MSEQAPPPQPPQPPSNGDPASNNHKLRERRGRRRNREHDGPATALGNHSVSFNQRGHHRERFRGPRTPTASARPKLNFHFLPRESFGPLHHWKNGKSTDPANDPPATEEMLQATAEWEMQYGEQLRARFGDGEDVEAREWNYPVWWLKGAEWVREETWVKGVRWVALSVLGKDGVGALL